MNNQKQNLLLDNKKICQFINENTKLLLSSYNQSTCKEIAQKIDILSKDDGGILSFEEKLIVSAKIASLTEHLRKQHFNKNVLHFSTNINFLFSANYLIDLIKLKEQEKTLSSKQNKEDHMMTINEIARKYATELSRDYTKQCADKIITQINNLTYTKSQLPISYQDKIKIATEIQKLFDNNDIKILLEYSENKEFLQSASYLLQQIKAQDKKED